MFSSSSRLLTHVPIMLLALAAPAWAGDVTVTPPPGDGFVVEDSAANHRALRVDEATGNVSRNGALFVHTTGTDNTFVGEGAGNLATGSFGGNSAFCNAALSSVTTGIFNSAFGTGALEVNTGPFNAAFGSDALASNTAGASNSSGIAPSPGASLPLQPVRPREAECL